MRPVSPYRPGICRKCGCYTNGLPRCPYCGTYQPESGPRLQAEGTKPPVNGIAVAALITGGAAMMFGIFGVIALTGIILGIFGIVEANKRGQTGVPNDSKHGRAIAKSARPDTSGSPSIAVATNTASEKERSYSELRSRIAATDSPISRSGNAAEIADTKASPTFSSNSSKVGGLRVASAKSTLSIPFGIFIAPFKSRMITDRSMFETHKLICFESR